MCLSYRLQLSDLPRQQLWLPVREGALVFEYGKRKDSAPMELFQRDDPNGNGEGAGQLTVAGNLNSPTFYDLVECDPALVEVGYLRIAEEMKTMSVLSERRVAQVSFKQA